MKLRDLLIAVFCEVAGWMAFPLVPIALLFAVHYKTPWEGSFGSGASINRLRLRWPFRWLDTPNEPLPGGFHEERVRLDYRRHGWYRTSLHWLWRHRALRLAFRFGIFVDAYLAAQEGRAVHLPGDVRVWRYQKTLGRVRLACGWRVVRATPAERPLMAVPFIGIRNLNPTATPDFMSDKFVSPSQQDLRH
jgi:hypothetical protein